MPHTDDVEALLCLVSSLDRAAVTSQLLQFHASFPVDFTPAFLEAQPLDRLRHLLFALCLHCRQTPTAPLAA